MFSLYEQIQTLEESSESLGERCLKFYKGCRKYTWEHNCYVSAFMVFISSYLFKVLVLKGIACY